MVALSTQHSSNHNHHSNLAHHSPDNKNVPFDPRRGREQAKRRSQGMPGEEGWPGCPARGAMPKVVGRESPPKLSFTPSHTMIPLITNHTDELAEICRRHHVKRLEVFGSAAIGDFNSEKSDIDFLVDYQLLPPANTPTHTSASSKTSSPSSVVQSISSKTKQSKTLTSAHPSMRHANPSTDAEIKTYLADIKQAAERIH